MSFRKYVYIIDMPGHPFCKIGITQELTARLSQIQNGNPYPLKIYFCQSFHDEMAQSIEHEALQRLSDSKGMGEWIAKEPSVVASVIHEVIREHQETDKFERRCETCNKLFAIGRNQSQKRFCRTECSPGYQRQTPSVISMHQASG